MYPFACIDAKYCLKYHIYLCSFKQKSLFIGANMILAGHQLQSLLMIPLIERLHPVLSFLAALFALCRDKESIHSIYKYTTVTVYHIFVC